MDKLKANMAAAEMLGLETTIGKDFLTSPAVACEPTDKRAQVFDVDGGKFFNIFTNPSDLVAVVKCLGEKHQTYLIPITDGTAHFWQSLRLGVSYSGEICRTYEEAAGAACIATQEGV